MTKKLEYQAAMVDTFIVALSSNERELLRVQVNPVSENIGNTDDIRLHNKYGTPVMEEYSRKCGYLREQLEVDPVNFKRTISEGLIRYASMPSEALLARR